MTSLSQNQIDALTTANGNRWQRGEMDRIYFNYDQLAELADFQVDRYKTGNISCAVLGGEVISNSRGRKIYGQLVDAKVYVDVKTGEISIRAHGDDVDWAEVREAIESIMAVEPEPTPETVVEPVTEQAEGEIAEEQTEAPNFRVSNNANWAHEFTAHTPAELAEGIRKAWDRYIVEKSGFDLSRLGHPGIAARVRLGQIDQWEAERAERDASPEVRRSWQMQAGTWRAKAKRELGVSRDLSPLYLHTREHGHWNAITTQGTAGGANWVRVIRVEPDAAELFDWAEGARYHVQQVAQIAGWAAEGLYETRLTII